MPLLVPYEYVSPNLCYEIEPDKSAEFPPLKYEKDLSSEFVLDVVVGRYDYLSGEGTPFLASVKFYPSDNVYDAHFTNYAEAVFFAEKLATFLDETPIPDWLLAASVHGDALYEAVHTFMTRFIDENPVLLRSN